MLLVEKTALISFLSQSEVKPKLIISGSLLHVLAQSSDWCVRWFTSFVISQSNYFDSDFTIFD